MGSLRTYGRKKNIILWYTTYLPKGETCIMVYHGRNRGLEHIPSEVWYRKGDPVTVEDREIIQAELKKFPRIHYVELAPLETFCKFGCGRHYKRDANRLRHEIRCSSDPVGKSCESCRYEEIGTLYHHNTGRPMTGRLCKNPIMDGLDDFAEDRPLFSSRSYCHLWKYRYLED